MIPEVHQRFIDHAEKIFRADTRFLGLLGAGSMITGNMDEYSDIDFIAVCYDEHKDSVTQDRYGILQKLGKLLSAFTGEHVGEPRVYICLYDEPLLHVDVKFISISELKARVENPVILFEVNEGISKVYQASQPKHPMPDLQWIEDRFWTWIHYAALRLGRGEIFEVLDMLSFIRGNVLGPLALVEKGQLPRGVRRLEVYAADYSKMMEKTVATYSRSSCVAAIEASIQLYKELANKNASISKREEVEEKAIKYFKFVAKQVSAH